MWLGTRKNNRGRICKKGKKNKMIDQNWKIIEKDPTHQEKEIKLIRNS
jgi:hypothetical protein